MASNPSNGEAVKEVAEKLKSCSVDGEKDKTTGEKGDSKPKSRNNSHNNQNKNRQRRRPSGAGGEVAEEKGEKKNKSRQNSTRRDSQSVSQTRCQKGSESDKRRTRSTNSNGPNNAGGNNKSRQSKNSSRTISQGSNGDGYYCSDAYDDLEEPFTDSEDEERVRRRKSEKPNLFIPRGRIRTLSGTVPVTGYSPKWGGPTMCLSCLQFFDLPEQMDSFAEHLLMEHKIIVQEIGLIVDPKRYIEYWRQRFAKQSIDKIFPRIELKEGEPYADVTDYYFEMSEKLPEDYSLRQRLAMRRLEEALSCQQRERDDTNFSQQCIFCRYTAKGNRSKIIHHLYMIHHLNLGSPDNLVFVTEYIAHLKEKLDRQECIYCEKTFADRNTLMDHMRKRNHREVNPKNHYYDKFYIINYLELGKRWLDVLSEDFEDTTTAFPESDEELEEESWCEWQEDNIDVDETRVVCLLCDETAERGEQLIEHMKAAHEFDILKVIEDNKLDIYQRMKLINFIRAKNFNAICWRCGKEDNGNIVGLHKHFEEVEKPIKELPDPSRWDVEENLVPLFGNDHFLWMLEGILDKDSESDDEEENRSDPKKRIEQLIKKSQRNTISHVVAEDLPTLEEVPDLEDVF